MSASQPRWRQLFDRAERAVGAPLEELVTKEPFHQVVLLTLQARSAARAVVERPTRALLHAINIPALTDVRRINRQLGALTSEMRELSARLGDAPQQPDRAEPDQRPGRGQGRP